MNFFCRRSKIRDESVPDGRKSRATAAYEKGCRKRKIRRLRQPESGDLY